MPTLAQLANNIQRAMWRLEAAKLSEASKRASKAARRGYEEDSRAALGDAQAAIERAFATLSERAT